MTHGKITVILAAGAALAGQAAAAATCRGSLVYFASMETGANAGIMGARLDQHSGKLCSLGKRALLAKPIWLVAAAGEPLLYAASEIGDAAVPSVAAFRIDRKTGNLVLINRVTSGGAAVAFMSINAASHSLLVAHWGGGQVSTLPIRSSGGLDGPAMVIAGKGTGPNRVQAIPRSHAIVAEPGNRFVLVTEFSGDRIGIYRFDAASRRLEAHDPTGLALAPGSGPRHILFSPDGRFAYVVNQLSSKIAVLAWDGVAGTLSPVSVVSTIAPTFAGQTDAAGLRMSRDGKWLYVSNRGEDTIVVFAVDRRSGQLVETQRIASGGQLPRAIDLDGSERWLLASNQASNRVDVFERDRVTGMLQATPNSLNVSLPAGAAFASFAAN